MHYHVIEQYRLITPKNVGKGEANKQRALARAAVRFLFRRAAHAALSQNVFHSRSIGWMAHPFKGGVAISISRK